MIKLCMIRLCKKHRTRKTYSFELGEWAEQEASYTQCNAAATPNAMLPLHPMQLLPNAIAANTPNTIAATTTNTIAATTPNAIAALYAIAVITPNAIAAQYIQCNRCQHAQVFGNFTGNWIPHMSRVGQNCIYTPYTTVCMVISLPKMPYIHRIYL